MPKNGSRITYLLQRYASKTCSREELEELFAYIASQPEDSTLHEFMETAWQEQQPGATVPDVDLNSVYHNIIPTTPVKRVFPFRYAAAAALLLAVATLAFLWQRPNRTSPQDLPAIQQPVAVISPGSNKAVLTLSNGATITLDSSGQQVISGGNGNQITQQNGQLVYGAAATADHIQYHTLSTPRGGQFRLTLPDGTKVWLNSASSLRYPTAFKGAEREVELQGQGYFDVAQNAAQPFKVKVNTVEVQVLGTGFDIMAYGDEATINTTLVSGAVQVKSGNNLQRLQPGQQAVFNQQSHALSVQEADVDKITAWKSGLFVFNNMTLTAILREVARWYDVEIAYDTTPSTELYGGGISRSLPLADVLKLLEANGFNHFRIAGRKVIVLP
ncbi:DUF4974 domain-containing protein [Chitinophaga agrisoli]|uniref:DUF4974 domain-containing protein n=1 Tax=Chitinophaga agrisoli TaxID=2607653 RepID=A0A5B2VW05_9BACT|nr:FecR family protein [Chitinophaga agrisoli]KAA2243295.1 DUF4974 domain-containing protein [Chitinophaga agrisoli]